MARLRRARGARRSDKFVAKKQKATSGIFAAAPQRATREQTAASSARHRRGCVSAPLNFQLAALAPLWRNGPLSPSRGCTRSCPPHTWRRACDRQSRF
eukprot:4730337-Prymnesium_polylepis.2